MENKTDVVESVEMFFSPKMVNFWWILAGYPAERIWCISCVCSFGLLKLIDRYRRYRYLPFLYGSGSRILKVVPQKGWWICRHISTVNIDVSEVGGQCQTLFCRRRWLWNGSTRSCRIWAKTHQPSALQVRKVHYLTVQGPASPVLCRFIEYIT